MRIPSLLLASFALGSLARAQDESPYYVQFGGGVVSTTDLDVGGESIEFDPGFTVSLAVGREICGDEDLSVDGEVELFYQAFKFDEDDIGDVGSQDDGKTFSMMLNGLARFHMTEQYSLYAGLGFGWAEEIEYGALDDDGLAFQGRAGMGYNLGGSYDVLLGYRFFKTEPVDIGDTGEEIDVEQHSLEVGFRWAL